MMRFPLASPCLAGAFVIGALCTVALPAAAADAWYIGVGAGAALLEPDIESGVAVSEKVAAAGTLFLGRDLDNRTSVQLQGHALGEAELANGDQIGYFAIDGSLLYRLADSRRSPRSHRGVALYGRVGIGFMNRDTGTSLTTDQDAWAGLGVGLEFMINPTLSLRTEALYYDEDAGAGFASVVARFGGRSARRTAARPWPVPAPAPAPPQALVAPSTAPAPVAGADADGDAVADAADVCPVSTPGFPVRDNGCALFDGVLSRVRFLDSSEQFAPGASEQLDELARLLERFPQSRIVVQAHSDARGSPRDQAILTRARLRTVGLYLIGRGIAGNRLMLRSFGGDRPLGGDRRLDNRIEIYESTL